MNTWRRATAVTLGGALAATMAIVGQTAVASPSSPSSDGSAAKASTPMKDAFAKSAKEFGVPRDLLVAVAYGESHLNGHHGQPSNDNGYGVMHLVSNPERHTLDSAAKLTGESADHLKRVDAANIRGGAAVLRHYADSAGLSAAQRQDLGKWYPAVARYGVAKASKGATEGGSLARFYADNVYGFLQKGFSAEPAGSAGKSQPTVKVAPNKVSPDRGGYAHIEDVGAKSPDYPDGKWVPANEANYKKGRSAKISNVIIHTTEGSYAGTVQWFQNPQAETSSHYVLRSNDGEVTQMVRDGDTAWHARGGNDAGIGVEHEGYVDDAKWYTDAMYRSSAALVKHLCDAHQIPKDRKHIVGHSEVPGNDHTDPGPHWDWDKYMKLVNG